MVTVKSCDFSDLDGMAELFVDQTGLPLSAKMNELVLFQDTNMSDTDGLVVYEGDIVVADVMNLLGSYERLIAEVIFDETNWGYNLDFAKYSGLPLTGEMHVIKVVGNVFEGPNDQLVKQAYEWKDRDEKE